MSDQQQSSENPSTTEDESGTSKYDKLLAMSFDDEEEEEQIDSAKSEVILEKSVATQPVEKPKQAEFAQNPEPVTIEETIKTGMEREKKSDTINPQRINRIEPQTDNETVAARKIGIVGGQDVGKTYLFHALAYLATDTSKLGCLAYFFGKKAVTLESSNRLNSSRQLENLVHFTEEYSEWSRLKKTFTEAECWYWLNFPYQTGFNKWKTLTVEFLDAAGETLEQKNLPPDKKENYRKAYADAEVMIFCLPLWVAFPGDNLTEDDKIQLKWILKGFHFLVDNYKSLFNKNDKRLQKVRTVLALTMADDERCRLDSLRDNWIMPLTQKNSRASIQEQLRSGKGVATYLANARKVSETLLVEFDKHKRPEVSGIINSLTIGKHKPWLIPVSAMDGAGLNTDADYKRDNPPQPAHVDLLLLVALCAYENALM